MENEVTDRSVAGQLVVFKRLAMSARCFVAMPWHGEHVAGAAGREWKESFALNRRCFVYKLKAGEEKLEKLVSGKVLGKHDGSGEDGLRPRFLILSSASYRNM